jgi:hypothetical protein
MADTQKTVYGVGAEFASASSLYQAAEKLRDKGFKRWDVHSPYPIHGMDKAMGLGNSWVSAIVLVCGMTGLAVAFTLQVWTTVFHYPLIVQGKPYMSLPAFVPIMFELTVLFSAFGALFGMLFVNGLPKLYHPVFNWDRFAAKATDDGFFAIIEARDPLFSEAQTKKFLEQIGGRNVTVIYDEE